MLASASSSSLHLNRSIFRCMNGGGSEGRAAAHRLPKEPQDYRVLVLGGTGRVGGSTARALSKFCPGLQILIGGRNRKKGAALVSMLGENCKFVEVNIDDVNSLEGALNEKKIMGKYLDEEVTAIEVWNSGLENATQTAYVDVCDDTNYASRAKSFLQRAVAADVPAITTGGIYPGVSNVMAAELVRHAANENTGEPEKLRFLYYTAGSGGAGPTILATSFLLLGEDVIAYNKGEKIKLKPYSGMLNIDFGKGIGKRDVYLLHLPEVKSAHEVLSVPTVSARFGTSPFFWNWGMEAIVKLVPAEFLREKSKVKQLVQIFDPIVRAFDWIAGERVSMRVDLELSNGRNTTSIFSHRRLSIKVVAKYLCLLLEGHVAVKVFLKAKNDRLKSMGVSNW
ncbi:hypothetical protein ACLOJK_016647 [Asimina triloba]